VSVVLTAACLGPEDGLACLVLCKATLLQALKKVHCTSLSIVCAVCVTLAKYTILYFNYTFFTV
jgi:hypothetical protein